MIRYINGDLFNMLNNIPDKPHPNYLVPHVVNNIGAFGAGFAGGVRTLFPRVYKDYAANYKQFKLGDVQFVDISWKKVFFANMFGQNGVRSAKNPKPISYKKLDNCLVLCYNWMKENGPAEIHAPMFGSGLAGGDWNVIEDMIKDRWKDFDVWVYRI